MITYKDVGLFRVEFFYAIDSDWYEEYLANET